MADIPVQNSLFQDLIKLRKLFIKHRKKNIFTNAWFKNDFPKSKSFEISGIKPKFLKRLIYLYIDDNYWRSLANWITDNDDKLLEGQELYRSGVITHYRRTIMEIIFLIYGINTSFYDGRTSSIEKIVGDALGTISASLTGNWFNQRSGLVDFGLRDSKTKSWLDDQNEEVSNLLKTAKMYLEAISVVWKYNEVKDSEDFELFSVKYFSLVGLHKIIGGRSQSVRNLISSKSWGETLIEQIDLHDFLLKENTTLRKGKEIKALRTKDVVEYLSENDYSTNLNVAWQPVFLDHCTRILEVNEDNSDTWEKVKVNIGLQNINYKLKIYGVSDFIKKKCMEDSSFTEENFVESFESYSTRNKNNKLSSRKYRTTELPAYFTDELDELHELLDCLKNHKEILNINSEFLEVKKEIDIVGLNKFYKKEVAIVNKPFQNLYLNHKREFIEVLSKINAFNDSISKLDHLIFIPQPKDDIDTFNAIALILKNYVDEKCLPKPISSTLIMSDPINNQNSINTNYFDKVNVNNNKLKYSFDSVLHIDINKLVDYFEDMNIKSYSLEPKKIQEGEIVDILKTLQSIHADARLPRMDNIDIDMYKKYIKGMNKAGSFMLNQSDQKQSRIGFAKDRYEYQISHKQKVKRLILVTRYKPYMDSPFTDPSAAEKKWIEDEDFIKSKFRPNEEDEFEFLWFELNWPESNNDFYVRFIES